MYGYLLTVLLKWGTWLCNGRLCRCRECRLRLGGFCRRLIKTAVKEKRINPKRMQREVKRQMFDTGIGTKSQQALKLQHELFKTERKIKRVQTHRSSSAKN